MADVRHECNGCDWASLFAENDCAKGKSMAIDAAPDWQCSDQRNSYPDGDVRYAPIGGPSRRINIEKREIAAEADARMERAVKALESIADSLGTLKRAIEQGAPR